jgi:aldose 1-epimerase
VGAAVSRAPSGEQIELIHGEQRAVIVEVGAGVRAYAVGAREVLDPYAERDICDGAHGAPLIPWPNRVGDGCYRFDGVEHRLALSEPAAGNAIHGLLRWRPWQVLERERTRVVMGVPLHPQPGYPFALDLTIAYELGEGGLTVSTTVVNVGDRACPYGAGQHPYLSAGEALVDACLLELPAATRLLSDARRLPSGEAPVLGGELDFRRGRLLGALRLDDTFTDLAREHRDRALVRLHGPDGHTVELWVDGHHDYLQLFTGDTLTPARRRRGLAVEPMTCAPNAFQSGRGLTRLDPGASFTSTWGVRLLDRR